MCIDEVLIVEELVAADVSAEMIQAVFPRPVAKVAAVSLIARRLT